ncbi:MAG: hypothetical protein ACYC64_04055 [Armatimonadota bacterium]
MRVSSAVLSILVAASLIAWPLEPGSAGEYHTGSTLHCSDCHITHASASHDQSGQSLGWTQTPNTHLTKGNSSVEVCLQCHNNQQGIPDVVGIDINNPSERYDGDERAGGQFSDDNSDNTSGHNLPGQGAGSPGDCTACHDPHGNSNYRNLRALDGSSEGPVAYVNPTATGLDRYRRSNIGYVRNIGDKLCIRCHEFGGQNSFPTTNGRYHRHPSSSVATLVKMYSSSVDAQHWIEGMGSGFTVKGEDVPRVPFAMSTAANYRTATTVSSDNEVFCLSCHKAHGSVHAFGTLWPYGTGDGLTGASGCNQCHNISGD